MTTTGEKYAGEQARNYSTLPKHDVAILDDHRICAKCGGEIIYDREVKASPYSVPGAWVHVEAPEKDHYTTPRLRCTYCGCQDPALVKYHQKAWSDETHCERCGGVDGFGIGD